MYCRSLCCNHWSSEERLDGNTVVITGANTGIGKETARDLARRGARIIMACRDLERAEEARTDILEDTGNENMVIRKLDLSDTKSIRAFAEVINKEEKQVNILINNAGIMMCPYSKTVDGFEMQLGVNHLGHVLLTYLLLDLIKRSAPARIVVVASVAHTWTGLRLDDINSEKSYDAMKAYGQSKLANVLFACSLAKRLQGTGVSVFSLHPGVVQSDLWRHQHQCIQVAVKILRIFTKTTVEGAQTTIYCAVEPGLESLSGGYFSDCAPASCSRTASDDDLAQKLWEVSCNMLGITWHAKKIIRRRCLRLRQLFLYKGVNCGSYVALSSPAFLPKRTSEIAQTPWIRLCSLLSPAGSSSKTPYGSSRGVQNPTGKNFRRLPWPQRLGLPSWVSLASLSSSFTFPSTTSLLVVKS